MSEQTEKAPLILADPVVLWKNFRRIFRRTFWLVFLLAGALGAFFGLRAKNGYVPMYEATAVLSVNAGFTSTTDILSYSDYYNTAATKQVISTFSSIIGADAMQEMIRQDLGKDYINGSISPSIVAESNLFTLKVRSSDPQDAYDILCSVIERYPQLAAMVIGATRITLIDEPVMPTAPVNAPPTRSAAVKGAALGAAAALALILLLSLARRTVHSTEDMKAFSSLPCLGLVPQIAPKRRDRAHGAPVLSVLNPGLNGAYTEAIHTVVTRLVHMCKASGKKVILVTSTIPGEGKTTIAANLALSLARTGSRVILADADLRLQTLQDFFGLGGESAGLVDLLRSETPDACAALQPVEGSSLLLLSGSTSEASPHGLFLSRRVRAVVEQLRAAADYVILDTPPIGTLADAVAFLHCADAALYVVKEDYASRAQLTDSLQTLSDTRAPVLGYVLNGTSLRAGRYGYGYDKGYGYGKYGYSKYGKTGYGYKKTGYDYSHYGKEQ